jgi:hypothetical protein
MADEFSPSQITENKRFLRYLYRAAGTPGPRVAWIYAAADSRTNPGKQPETGVSTMLLAPPLSSLESVHLSVFMLLETAYDLVAVAKDFKPDLTEDQKASNASAAEQAFKAFYGHASAYWGDGWAERKQAIDYWIGFCESSPTALEQIHELVQQVLHAAAQDLMPGDLSLAPSGPSRKQMERFTKNWPAISQNLRGVTILDKDKLRRELDQELARSRAVARFADMASGGRTVKNKQEAPTGALSDQEWSIPETPSRLAKIFNLHRDTIVRRLKDGTIPNIKLSSRRYQVAVDSIPALHRDKYRQKKTESKSE